MLTSGAFHMPLRTISEGNQREHWRGRSTRRQKQREMAGLFTKAWMDLHGIHTHPSANNRNAVVIRVAMLRLAQARLDQGNLAYCFKAVQDGVCDALAIEDGDPLIEWDYEQVSEAPTACYGVIVAIYFKPWKRK